MAREGRGCLRRGCMGCLALVAILIGAALVWLALGWSLSPASPSPETVRRVHQTPRAARSSPPTPSAPVQNGQMPAVAEPGRIVLDVGMASFSIVAGPPGSALALDARYDKAGYELTEGWESQGEVGWIYRLGFARRGFGLIFDGDIEQNRLTLTLPADMPVILEGRIGIGQSNLEFGGLWIVETDLELGIGEHAMSLNAPLRAPMRRLRLAASVGELRVRGLGHASPGEVEIRHRIGEVDVDLRGAWQNDAEVLVRCGIGECRVGSPDAASLVVEQASVTIGEASGANRRDATEPGRPVVRLNLSAGLGEVRVD